MPQVDIRGAAAALGGCGVVRLLLWRRDGATSSAHLIASLSLALALSEYLIAPTWNLMDSDGL